MTKTFLTRWLLVMVALGWSLGATLFTAPSAHANTYSSSTSFYWSGPVCITTLSPQVGNYWVNGWDRTCSAVGAGGFTQIVATGQQIGILIPLQGGVRFASCSVSLNGVLVWSDSADASLGSGEANCSRTVTG